MFDVFRLKEALVKYKEAFAQLWPNEKFKWEAVKCFQDNWDVNAPDFAAMLSRSFAKTAGLLASMNNFPARMIEGFAKVAPEEVRAMFIELFDESKDVVTRVLDFKNKSSVLLEKYGNGAGQHYQYENAVSTYLWLRYPDKYYIYKFGEIKQVADELGSDYRFKKGSYADNLRNFYALYDEICEELKKDGGLISLVNSQLADDCYADPELRTLTIDVGFFISRRLSPEGDTSEVTVDSDGYYPSLDVYNPNLTKEDWIRYLTEVEIPDHPSPMQMLKGMMELGGEATCKKLATVYGGKPARYVGCTANLGRRAKKYFNLPSCMDGDDDRVFVIPFLGRRVTENGVQNYSYKIRPELFEALQELDLSAISPYFTEELDASEHNFWWLNANPRIWSFSSVGIGETQSYTLYNENGNKRRIFQNFLDVKLGDIVIAYESAPSKKIVGLAVITAESDGEKIEFQKTETLVTPIDYATLKGCIELEDMEFFVNPNGSLFKLTKDEYELIMDMIREENPTTPVEEIPTYDKNDFLNEVYMTEGRYDTLVAVLKNKKNIILQGAPGVGKTFAAKRLAYSIMGVKDESRIEFVQFHQNYSYEDFMMGYKPVGEGFELKYGIFYRFCQKAANQPDKDFFFVIDEINRGNMSKIFGELLMLIERDYRGTKTTLAYDGYSFSVPKNLYIIGMMNTADRSLAMIDYALRRRFSFFEIEPGFESEGFKKYQDALNNETFSLLVSKIQDLNREIALDKSLGRGFCIGHSYFCGQTECNEEWMRAIVDYDVLPMLSEYWFDDANKLQRWENILRGVFQ